MGQTSQDKWELSVVAERLRLVEAKLAFTMNILNLTRNEDGASRNLETLFQEWQHAGPTTENLGTLADRAFRGSGPVNAAETHQPPAPTGDAGTDDAGPAAGTP